jgi:hypothetical protein
MVTDKDIELIQRYLNTNYPVQRLKYDGKFKRVITFDNGDIILLSHKNNKPYIKKEMTSNINLIFGFKPEEIEKFILSYLKI